MLKIDIPDSEMFNELTNEFVIVKGQTLNLEHSLLSLSKWESRWKKPFLSKDQKTIEETIDYIRCMTITPNVDPDIYNYLPKSVMDQVAEYIDDTMTATWFSDDNKKTNKDVVTAEIIYYWMIASNIPFECQKWHLNRLLTLIRVCSLKNEPPKKMSEKEIFNRNKALNDARRKASNSNG